MAPIAHTSAMEAAAQRRPISIAVDQSVRKCFPSAYISTLRTNEDPEVLITPASSPAAISTVELLTLDSPMRAKILATKPDSPRSARVALLGSELTTLSLSGDLRGKIPSSNIE